MKTRRNPYLFSGIEAAYRGRVNCMYDGGLGDGEGEVDDGCGGDGELLQQIPDVRPHCFIEAIALTRPFLHNLQSWSFSLLDEYCSIVMRRTRDSVYHHPSQLVLFCLEQ